MSGNEPEDRRSSRWLQETKDSDNERSLFCFSQQENNRIWFMKITRIFRMVMNTQANVVEQTISLVVSIVCMELAPHYSRTFQIRK